MAAVADVVCDVAAARANQGGLTDGTVAAVSTVRTGTSTVLPVFGASSVMSPLATAGTSMVGVSTFGTSGMSILPAASRLPMSILERSTAFTEVCDGR